MSTPQPRRLAFDRDGFVLVEQALPIAQVAMMADIAARLSGPRAAGHRLFSLTPQDVNLISAAVRLTDLISELEARPLRLVRVIAFDKSPEANWFVPWHQDRTIAVENRVETPGFSRWTLKDGCHHVEPPAELLASMVTLRVHLDRCDAFNGPLEVQIGSHRTGRLDTRAIGNLLESAAKLCVAEKGDVLAMRPLLVHRSQRALKPARRRVLHLEYGPTQLPGELRWALGY